MNQNSTSNIQSGKLLRIDFDNYFDVIDAAKAKETISEILNTHASLGTDISIRNLFPLGEQKILLEDLQFELKRNTEILQVLIDAVFKLDDNSKEFLDMMNNISLFIYTNIKDVVEKKLHDLNEVLEYEENRRSELLTKAEK